MVFSGYSCFIHQYNWPPRCNWNIVENGVKHHNPNPDPITQLFYIQICLKSKSLLVEKLICSMCSSHDIAEILLKLALNNNQSILNYIYVSLSLWIVCKRKWYSPTTKILDILFILTYKSVAWIDSRLYYFILMDIGDSSQGLTKFFDLHVNIFLDFSQILTRNICYHHYWSYRH